MGRVTRSRAALSVDAIRSISDEQLDRPIALKVIRPNVAMDAVARERFWREARAAARVSHAHVCQVYDGGESDGRLFLAMERLEGESLARGSSGERCRSPTPCRRGSTSWPGSRRSIAMALRIAT